VARRIASRTDIGAAIAGGARCVGGAGRRPDRAGDLVGFPLLLVTRKRRVLSEAGAAMVSAIVSALAA
jgi:hypothetical protein